MTPLEERLQAIEDRNHKVDADKAWETSTFRKVSILVITYAVAVVVMYTIGVGDVFFNALIPTIGFFLSTLTMPALKRWWLQKKR